MIERWYSPGVIKFTRLQMLWLIKNLVDLRGGRWTPNPEGSHSIDMPLIRKGKRGKSPSKDPCLIAAEVEIRLERCGIDGLILEATVGWGKSDQSLSKYLGMPVWSVKKRAKRALRYISSGEERERMSYREFKGQKKNGVLSR